MALIKCPECGQEVSNLAPTCIHCGYPLNEEQTDMQSQQVTTPAGKPNREPLTKKKKINEGEIQQYYIEGSHPAIISPEFFDLVQIELEKRKGQKRSTAGVFASMLICGNCGNFYGSSRKVYKHVLLT